MIIQVAGGCATLLDSHVFSAFSVRTSQDIEREELSRALAQAAVDVDVNHVWIKTEWLRAQVPDPDETWSQAFCGMIDYARTKGWYDDARSAIRAHVERS